MLYKITYESGKDVLIANIEASDIYKAVAKFFYKGYGTKRDILKVEVKK